MSKNEKKSKVLRKIIGDLDPVDFKTYLNIDPKINITEKHQVVGVVKYLKEKTLENDNYFSMRNGVVYLYNGEFWEVLEKDELKTFLGYCSQKIGCHETSARHFEFRDKLLKQFINEVNSQIPTSDESKIRVNLQNGTVDIDNDGNWFLRGFKKDDFMTYQLPFSYDPAAICPLFDKFLMTVLPEESSRMLLQEFLGYIFSRENLEKMLMLLGSGANGKSVVFEIVMAIVGKEFVLNFSLGEFKKETNRAALENILVNYSSEKGIDLSPDTLKALVSSEPVQARNLYGKPFNLQNKARFIINTNSLPKETEQTDAYFRRWLIINFGVTIPEEKRDTDLAKKIISSELPGIFNWILVGLNRISKNKKFSTCQKADNDLMEFKKQSDNVALFVEDQMFIKSESKKMAMSEIFMKYRNFCREDGYYSLGKNNFSKRLEALGFEKGRLSDGNYCFFMEKEVFKDEISNSEFQDEA